MRHDFESRHSLPVPEERTHAPLYVTNVGREKIEPGEAYPRKENSLYGFIWEEGRTLPEFCLAWIHLGSGMLDIRLGRQIIPEKRAFLFRPGEWHRHRPDPDIGWTLYWISFNGELPRRWMLADDFLLEGNLPLIADPDLFEVQFERLLATVDRSPITNSDALSCQAAGLLSHFLRHGEEQGDRKPVHDDEVVNRAVEFIWNHHYSTVGVPEVAAYVGKGRRCLERRFAEVLGRSVLQEIQLCRFSRAKRLVEESTLPLKQIVHLAGFRSRHQLRLLFHKHVGMSPEAYREKAGKP